MKNLPKILWRESDGIMTEFDVISEVRPGVILVKPSRFVTTKSYWHNPAGFWTVISTGKGVNHYFDKSEWKDCTNNNSFELIVITRKEYYRKDDNTRNYFIPTEELIRMYSFNPGEVISYESNTEDALK